MITVMDLIDLAEQLKDRVESDPSLLDKEIRFASQPSWPFEYNVDILDDAETDEAIYLVESDQIGYLPGEVKDLIGW